MGLKDVNSRNNTSYAESLITITTGQVAIYIGIVLVAGIILGVGIFIINRKI